MAAYFKEQRIAHTENIMRDVITKFIFLNQIFLNILYPSKHFLIF